MLSAKDKLFFENEGYLVVQNLITKQEVQYYDTLYNSFLNNSIDASKYRTDLSGGNTSKKEKITQIMVPSKVHPELLKKSIHIKSLQIAKFLLGNDIALDFDMLINKTPQTNTITPWHQDAAYWIDMPDKRAVSCWVAIDKSTKANGCMWYTPKSHLEPTLKHKQIGNKGALKCDGSEQSSIHAELEPGSCVFHHGNTLHYSRGNSTGSNRRALITNFRPDKMIALERLMGYDHTGERKEKT
jgi:ectoine hydroxylase-related dioxygenase (phytanoyl-CoA dioxygenase family)